MHNAHPTVTRTLPGIAVLCHAGDRALVVRRGRLNLISPDGEPTKVGSHIGSAVTRVFGAPAERLLRRRVFAVSTDPDSRAASVLLVTRSRLLLVDPRTAQVLAQRPSPVRRVLWQGVGQAPWGGWLLSSYDRNSRRNHPRVLFWVSPHLREVQAVTQLTGIRHVHSIRRDPFTGRIWLATGDEDAECKIGWFEGKPGQIRWVGGGSQDWRAVSLQFTSDAVWWGTDDAVGRNSIFKWHRSTGTAVRIGEVDGPIYYSARTPNGFAFFTTVEDRQAQLGIPARMWLVNDDTLVRSDICWPKDALPCAFFGYGMVEPALSVGTTATEMLWVTLWGLKGGLASQLIEWRAR